MNRICTLQKFDNAVFLKAHCSCGSDDHIQTLVLERQDDGQIYMSFFSKLRTTYWKKPIWKRFTIALGVLFSGYIEFENEFIMDSKEQIEDFAKSILENIDDLK